MHTYSNVRVMCDVDVFYFTAGRETFNNKEKIMK